MVIAVEGDMAPARVHAVLASMLDRPGIRPVRREGVGRSVAQTTAGRETLRLGPGAAATVALVLQWPASQDERAGRLIVRLLAQRLQRRLRDVEKASYDPDARFSVGAFGNAILQIIFSCAPENVERLVTAARDELASFRSAVSAQELENAVDRMGLRPLSTRDAAETWLDHQTLSPFVPLRADDLREWIDRNLRVDRAREFVLLPELATD